MHELTVDNLADFLRDRAWLPRGVPVRVRLLTGGVSNAVFRVEPDGGTDFVVKQSRPQLRTAAEWFARPERIFREVACLRLLTDQLPAGAVPRVLHEDREEFVFAMEAVPADHRVWKTDLLAGRCEPEVAQAAGRLLATVHRENPAAGLATAWRDKSFFEELRIDPYYRTVARAVPELRTVLGDLTERTLAAEVCLVHADFSPKNLLLSGLGVTLVDCETAHCGDPAFDVGFFLTHLLLKALKHRDRPAPVLELARVFWTTYLHETTADEQQVAAHLAACLLSRVAGKSVVEYLDPAAQAFVRMWASALLTRPPGEVAQVFADFERDLGMPTGAARPGEPPVAKNS